MARERDDAAFAARSDAAVSRFGAVVPLRAPAGEEVLTVLIDGTDDGVGDGDEADVVVVTRATGATSANGLVQQEALPGLTLQAAPGRLQAGQRQTVTFRTTDAGIPVPGVRVSTGRAACDTGADGTCQVRVRAPERGAVGARATADGFTAAALRLRVRR